jgi:hypothetical protein
MLAFAPSSARADDDAEYRDLIQRALVEYQGGRWEESRSLFERAHALSPNARTLRGIALASFEMRDYVRCVTALRGALDSNARKLDATQRKQAQKLLTQAEGYIAHRTVALTPATARVTVDGEDAQFSEGKLLLNPGKHELMAEAPGYQPQRLSIIAHSGSQGALEMQLAPAIAAGSIAQVAPPTAEQTARQGLGSNHDHVATAETEPAPNEPVTKRWWFWTGIGAVVLGGTAVALGVALGGDDGGRAPYYEGNGGSLQGP